jgi:pimeloyl-ACP methyl ester carboxylesterase
VGSGEAAITTVALRGVELRVREWGAGPRVLCLHETASDGEVWEPLALALEGRASTIAPDRRAWGGSSEPEPYGRTTVAEQAEDAAALLEALGGAPALVCGAGIGAVAALDLHLRRPDLSAGAVLVEPPLLAFVPDATEALSGDRVLLEGLVREGGPAAAVEAYLAGGLPALGPGADRLPAALAEPARTRPLSVFAELGAVPDWPLPLTAMAALDRPSRIVIGASSPPLLRAAAAGLAERLGCSRLHELSGGGLPHVEGATELAALIETLLEPGPPGWRAR